MKDTFDLTKFLKENKSLENLNPTFKSLNENKHVKDKIREMILAELSDPDDEYDTVDHGGDELEEAKKDKKVEDVEDVNIEDTTIEVPAEDTCRRCTCRRCTCYRWWLRRHSCRYGRHRRRLNGPFNESP
jgi:hypothetical protein